MRSRPSRIGGHLGLGIAFAAASCVPATAAPAADQAAKVKTTSGFEQRVYDLTVFKEHVPDWPGPSIEPRYAAPAGGVAGATFTLEEPLQVGGDPEILVSLIKTNIDEDSWSDQRTSIQIVGEDLVVVQRPEAHAKIAQMIAYLRREQELQIAVEGTVILIEDALLDELRAGAPNPAALTEAAAKALAAALAQGERAKRVRALRATARNGQRVNFAGLHQMSYIGDYDVMVSTATLAFDPRIEYLQLGAVLDVCPLFTRGHLACEVRFAHHTGTLPIPQFATGVPGMGPLHLPETAFSGVETTVTGQEGETLLIGRIGVADPKAPGGRAKSICFFVRPALVPIAAVPAPVSEEKRQMRIFDVGMLTSNLRDFPGRSITLFPESQGVACEEPAEPREVIPAQTLIEAIRHNLAPESWENTRNTIDIHGKLMYVRQTPPILDAIKQYLDGLAARRWRMIAMRADVVGAGAEAYKSLMERYPSLAAGVMKLDAAEVAEILARVARGDGLTRVASGEVAGMNRQRVNVCQANHLSYVRDYDVEVATLVAAPDPQIDDVSDGFVMDCQPVLTGDGKTIHANVRFTYAQLERPLAVETLGDKAIRCHRPAMSVARWRTSVVAGAGEYLLIGGGAMRLDGEERQLLAIVRFVPAP